MEVFNMLLVFGTCFLFCRAAELKKFPDEFIFGAASSAYQIEGAWNEDGNGESILDRLVHTRPELTANTSGDIACDSYHKYKRDVEMARELNLDAYRFSLSWSRILPTGFVNNINPAGIDYYNNLINELLKYNIQPIVTLFHWDLPQSLQDLGGWANPYIVDWFTDYARVAFENFGDRVQIWATMNEPRPICYGGYGLAILAPAINASGIGDYMCYHNVLLSHAKTYHLYEDEFKASQNGVVGLVADMINYQAESDSEEDQQTVQDARDFMYGIFIHPIYHPNGDYPPRVKELIAAKSAAQGYPRSRLVPFSDDEVEYIKGTYDYLGVNHYTSNIVYRNESTTGVYPAPDLFDDVGIDIYYHETWIQSQLQNSAHDPKSMYELMKDIRERYYNPIVYITENGWPTDTGLQDEDRIAYYRAQLNNLLDAIDEGSNIKGYMAWSLMDSFEWIYGYNTRLGLYEVDFDSPERTRTPRKSAFVYKEIVRNKTIDFDYNPQLTDMWIEEGH